MSTLPTIGYVDAGVLFSEIERAVMNRSLGRDTGELAACRARLSRCVHERAALLDVAASIEHALRMGFSPDTILEPGSAIREALQAVINKAATGSAS